MKRPSLLRTGIIGTVVTAICCFTPVLVVALGALGLSAWLGWVDVVLFPLLALFVGLIALAVYRRRGAGRPRREALHARAKDS
jgi:mercuric ion transport protein